MRQMLLVVLLVGASCTSDNPNYCEDDASCRDPAAPVCHPVKHYCHAGCASNEQCQDPAYPGHEPGKPVCERASGHCVAQRDGGGADARRDAALDQSSGDAAKDLLAPDGPKQKNGTPCASGGVCESGFCVDGYCCSGACDSVCVTCGAKGKEGSCVPVEKDQDPRKDCAGKHASCAGSCDGTGKCSFAAVLGKECAAPTCSAPGEMMTSTCDLAGACAAQKKGCGGFACAAGICKTSCTTLSDCAGTAQCVGGKCVDNLPLGSPCGTNKDACQSKLCTDGVCCTVASCGTCKACGTAGTCVPAGQGSVCAPPTCTGTAATGAAKTVNTCVSGSCTPSTTSCGEYLCGGDDCLTTCASDAQCKATAYCDGSAKCVPKKAVGQPCGAAKECQNGLCVDGYCCATACNGLCERCDLATKGQCLPIPNGQDPQNECPGQVAACKGSCNGNRACVFPVGTVCQGPSCSGSTLTSYACNASGACAGTPASCAPYTCAPSGTACRTTCAANAECTTAYCDLIGFPDATRLNRCAAASDLCKPTPTGPTIQSCLAAMKYYVQPANGTYAENLTVSGNVQIVATGTTPPLLVNRMPAMGILKVVLRPPATSTTGISIGAPAYLFGLELYPTGTGNAVEPNAWTNMRSCWIHDVSGSGFYRQPTGMAANMDLLLTDVAVSNCSAPGLNIKSVKLTIDRGYLGSNGITQYGNTLKLRDVLVDGSNAGGYAILTTGVALDLDRVEVRNASTGLAFAGNTTGSVWNTLVTGSYNEGILLQNSTPVFYNVTVTANNMHLTLLPNVSCGTGANVNFHNSIIWPGTLCNNSGCYLFGEAFTGNCLFSYSDVHRPSGVVPGTGNINVDPSFVSVGTLDARLQAGSPCLNAGTSSPGGVTPPALDLAGNPRSVSGIDMGAYERQ